MRHTGFEAASRFESTGHDDIIAQESSTSSAFNAGPNVQLGSGQKGLFSLKAEPTDIMTSSQNFGTDPAFQGTIWEHKRDYLNANASFLSLHSVQAIPAASKKKAQSHQRFLALL